MRIASRLTLLAALAALALLGASGPGTRLEAWPWQTGFALLRWATWLGLAAAAAGLLLAIAEALVARRAALAALAAVALGVAAAAPALVFRAEAQHVPPIHDITTDTVRPPPFEALLPERARAPNGAAYGGAAVAAAQRAAYPDIVPLHLALPPAEALRRAEAAARKMGWKVAAVDAARGRLEATARTTWFGFRDDVVVRVSPEPGGSRVDVRSASRVGRSDVGANARRIRVFLSLLG